MTNRQKIVSYLFSCLPNCDKINILHGAGDGDGLPRPATRNVREVIN